MGKRKALLILQSVFCVLTAVALVVADLSIYFEGVALKAEDPMADIYTAEAVAGKVVFVLLLFLIAVIVTLICAVLGVRDEKADKPAVRVDIKKNSEGGRLSGTALTAVRVVILALALICIVAGVINGSMTDVFIKASKICTECIGLG